MAPARGAQFIYTRMAALILAGHDIDHQVSTTEVLPMPDAAQTRGSPE
jgi:hypothetical protein